MQGMLQLSPQTVPSDQVTLATPPAESPWATRLAGLGKRKFANTRNPLWQASEGGRYVTGWEKVNEINSS